MREHPDLEQLKRQAKELLRGVCRRRAEAAAEVNAHYRAADASKFALHDAQLVLARSYGFESWPKLKAYVDGVTVRRLAEAVRADDLAQVRAMLQRAAGTCRSDDVVWRRASAHPFCGDETVAGDGAAADAARRECAARHPSAPRRHRGLDYRQGARLRGDRCDHRGRRAAAAARPRNEPERGSDRRRGGSRRRWPRATWSGCARGTPKAPS